MSARDISDKCLSISMKELWNSSLKKERIAIGDGGNEWG